jgi:RNA polymerase sigma-70 factor, ECF subfamily
MGDAAEPAERATRESRDALSATLAETEPVLARIAARLCGNPADARDLVQDTFERAMRQGIPTDVRNPRTWLATVMHNLFIDRCRSAKRRPHPESLEDDPGIAQIEPEGPEPAWSQITIDDIRSALEELDATYREVYVLHAFERWSYERIAEHLSIQRITVGTRLNRARKRLREVLVVRFGLESTP